VYYYCRSCNVLTSDLAAHAATCKRRDTSKPLSPVTFGPRECAQCYLGLKGKPSCPICGNTKEPPLDEFGRRIVFGRPDLSSRDLTESMSRPAAGRFEAGTIYKFNTGTKPKPEWREMRCIGTNGPLVLFADPDMGQPHVIHLSQIRDFEPIGEYEYEGWVDHTGDEPSELDDLEDEVNRLLGRG
jgi:hypothetical protein